VRFLSKSVVRQGLLDTNGRFDGRRAAEGGRRAAGGGRRAAGGGGPRTNAR